MRALTERSVHQKGHLFQKGNLAEAELFDHSRFILFCLTLSYVVETCALVVTFWGQNSTICSACSIWYQSLAFRLPKRYRICMCFYFYKGRVIYMPWVRGWSVTNWQGLTMCLTHSQPACARTWTKIITNHYFLTNRYFKVLSSGTSESDLLIRESLLISKITLVLNANIRSTMK
jgi:hypothetical protein